MANSNNININDFRKTFINPSYLWRSDNSRGIIWSQDINWGDISSSIGTLNSLTIIQKLEDTIDAISSLQSSLTDLTLRVSALENSPSPTAEISTTELGFRKTNNLSHVTWSDRSISSSTITSGETGTLTGTVTAIYEGITTETATITTSNIKGDLSITSSNTNVVSIGTVNNGSTTITAIGSGTATITVKDGSTTVNTFTVNVVNDQASFDVTSEAIFKQFINGNEVTNSISGTTVTAPAVQSNTTITIKAIYNDMASTETVTYTATPAAPAETYYWYVGTTKPTSLDYEGVTTVNEYPAEQLYTNESGSYSHVYILTKNDKTVTLYDANLGGQGELDDPDTITIPGYIIWTTYDAIPNTGKIRIVIS